MKKYFKACRLGSDRCLMYLTFLKILLAYNLKFIIICLFIGSENLLLFELNLHELHVM